MFYKEHDLNSYRMRFQRQWVVFRDVKTKEEFYAFVNEIGEDRWMLTRYNDDGKAVAVIFAFEAIEPKYHYIAPGFYHGVIKPNRVAYCKRRLAKTYHVGFGPQFDFGFYGMVRPQDTPNILKPVKIDVEKALKDEGAISKTLYLFKDKVFYLSNIVGFRKGKNFIVDPMFKSEMEDCLRGRECTVRL